MLVLKKNKRLEEEIKKTSLCAFRVDEGRGGFLRPNKEAEKESRASHTLAQKCLSSGLAKGDE